MAGVRLDGQTCGCHADVGSGKSEESAAEVCGKLGGGLMEDKGNEERD